MHQTSPHLTPHFQSSSHETPLPISLSKPSSKMPLSPPSLQTLPYLSLSIGTSSNPNPKHRPTMEDTSQIHTFSTFPSTFLAVYDGHGGTLASILLAQQLHLHFLHFLLPSPSSSSSPSNHTSITPSINHPLNTLALDEADAFRKAYAKMDSVLRNRRCFRTGATAVTCFIRQIPGVGRVLTTANCGDSRAVLSRAGRPLRLSQDHRPGDVMEKRRIENCGGFLVEGRVNGVLNVSRAFGDHSMKSAVVSTPWVKRVVLTSVDEFLVIGCDGLWDFVPESEVLEIVQEGLDRGLDCERVAGVLIQVALERKGTDNVSVIVVQLDLDE